MAQGDKAGARIRTRRMDRKMTQAALARDAGISASYLNLIEHGRRRVGGRVLGDIARVLDTDPARLAEGAATETLSALRRAVQRFRRTEGPGPEQAERFAGAFPDWADLVAAQEARIAALERQVGAMGERLAHDPALAASVHDVLSTVTAIRATAAILVEGEVEPQWRGRFHRNMHEDAQRLADSAQALSGYLTAGQTDAEVRAPLEEVEAWLAARGWHLAQIEAGARPEPPADMSAAGRAALDAHLDLAAADAAGCPAQALAAATEALGPDPFAIAQHLGTQPGTVMRRMAAVEGAAVGLVECDGSGALIFRRPVAGFEVPRYSAGCALWPLFQALLSPLGHRRDTVRQVGDGARAMTAFTTVALDRAGGATAALTARATMLLVPGADGGPAPIEVGTTCRLCPVEGCAARREPSALQGF